MLRSFRCSSCMPIPPRIRDLCGKTNELVDGRTHRTSKKAHPSLRLLFVSVGSEFLLSARSFTATESKSLGCHRCRPVHALDVEDIQSACGALMESYVRFMRFDGQKLEHERVDTSTQAFSSNPASLSCQGYVLTTSSINSS